MRAGPDAFVYRDSGYTTFRNYSFFDIPCDA